MAYGIFLALAAAFFFSAANMVDAQLSRQNFRSVGILLFYSCALNLVFALPVALHPSFALPRGASEWALLFLSSQLHLLSYYLLYNALKRYETSVITCLATLTLGLVPAVSAATDYEPLRPVQWLGFILCVASAIGLSYQNSLSKAEKRGIFYALACGVTFCACALLDDRLSGRLHWSAQYAGIQIFMLVTMGAGLFFRAFRRDVGAGGPVFRKNLRAFFGSEAAFALGTILAIIAFQKAQVSVVEAVIAGMPVMIFAMTFFIPKKWRHEDVSAAHLPRKIACFAVTVIGIYLLY